MSSDGTDGRTLAVLLGRTAWSVCRRDALLHSESGLAPAETLKSLTEWLRSGTGGTWWRRTQINVYLTGGICRPFLLPVLPALRVAEQRLAIDAAAKARTGLAEPLQVWLSPVLSGGAEGGRNHQFGAAVAQEDLTSLVAAIRSLRKVRLASIQPVWSLALQVAASEVSAVPSPLDLLLVQDDDSITLLAGAPRPGRTAEGSADGFAAALTIDRGLDAASQSHAVMRVVSGLEVEPVNSYQMRFSAPEVEQRSQPQVAEAAFDLGSTELPLQALLRVQAIDLERITEIVA